ncbi:dubious [Schizosaccharomyces pombe]|uniref:Putative uncharacterized protein C9E9.02 n=1 Tax=Schizosaccharomyces pombe (strain 972 / ATCC 24843) TaxID=284812 RepID=YF12_SCHPO|nr:uncharacterized protein SPAC9E9.02 [Schizosaccharomyces pombe]A6X978.1 RecName: Full=Putative uncharacterized protein C9E9.02 [Schizosaccharomyces pombe 972h-]CAO77647.1 dubious [Schizosaccharomyces pombe]|eukprot:NP_001343037.1 uncharacterized protein SPAC9E9.02 [Schizosaccharomyces pombe]
MDVDFANAKHKLHCLLKKNFLLTIRFSSLVSIQYIPFSNRLYEIISIALNPCNFSKSLFWLRKKIKNSVLLKTSFDSNETIFFLYSLHRCVYYLFIYL